MLSLQMVLFSCHTKRKVYVLHIQAFLWYGHHRYDSPGSITHIRAQVRQNCNKGFYLFFLFIYLFYLFILFFFLTMHFPKVSTITKKSTSKIQKVPKIDLGGFFWGLQDLVKDNSEAKPLAAILYRSIHYL